MKKLPLGLVIEGNFTNSSMFRLPGVAAELGPIKSSSLQMAKRVSNSLRSGFAASSFAELAVARTILIRAPDRAVRRLVEDIAKSDLECADHAFVLCETWAPTDFLLPLRELGAQIASVILLPSGVNNTFIVEGDSVAVRQVRRLLERTNAAIIELRPSTKHLFFAAAILCTSLPTPLLTMAQRTLRDAGLSGNRLFDTIQELSNIMLTSFMKGARVPVAGPLAEMSVGQELYWERLYGTHPELAGALQELVERTRDIAEAKMTRAHGA